MGWLQVVGGLQHKDLSYTSPTVNCMCPVYLERDLSPLLVCSFQHNKKDVSILSDVKTGKSDTHTMFAVWPWLS